MVNAAFNTYLATVVKSDSSTPGGVLVVVPGVLSNSPLPVEVLNPRKVGASWVAPVEGSRVWVMANHDFTQVFFSTEPWAYNDGEGKWAPGDLKQSIATTQPDGWLFFNQSIINANTAYPDLWAVAPAGWKSGTTLNLPNLDGRFLREGATVGTLAGSNTHTLTVTNLPSHGHTFTSGTPSVTDTGTPSNNTSGTPSNNTSGTPSVASTGTPSNNTTTGHSVDHAHWVDPPSATVGSSGSATQVLTNGAGTGSVAVTWQIDGTGVTRYFTPLSSFSVDPGGSWSAGVSVDHTHGMQSHTHSMQSHTHSLQNHTHSLQSHTHSLQSHTHSGTTDNVGSDTAVDHTPAHMTVRTMVKT